MPHNTEISTVASVDAFQQQLPRVGRGILGLFMPLDQAEFEPYVTTLTEKCAKDPKYRLKHYDIPTTVESLANIVAEHNGFKRSRSKMIASPSPRVFGNTHIHSGAHIDTNVENDESNMPLFGSWVQFNGASSVFLREIGTFDPSEMGDEIESLRMDTDDPDYELEVKIRPEREADFSRIDAVGPYFGTWAIGMSQDKNIYTVLHEVRQIGAEKRLSANLIQGFTDRTL